MKQQNPGSLSSASSQPTDPLAEPVRAMLAAGRWRKARDMAKLLCKQDQARYLPLLIEANIGLIRELSAKGLASEARQVLAYLKRVAPSDRLPDLEAELACLSGDKKALRDRALRLLTDPTHVHSPEDRVRLADQAVLAFDPDSILAPNDQRLVEDLRAVHQALEIVCAGRFEEALDRVRSLARDSVFSHWVLWIKGVIGFYRGDQSRAARCFDRLPAGSVPAKAAAGYRLLLGEPEANRAVPGEAQLETVCRILGRPGQGVALFKADTFWRGGKPDHAYDCLRRAIPEFPRVEPDPIGALSEFCFHSLGSLSEREQSRLGPLFERLGFRRKARSDHELSLALKAVCLELASTMEPEQLEQKWVDCLGALKRLHGSDPQRDSLGYTWLGEQFASENHHSPLPFPFLAHASGLRDGPRAVAALKRAAGLDPANLEPQLKLCEVYQKLGFSSDRNRLLDQMTRRFPDRKEVLFLAGQGCLERQAFKKGIDYLERARALDRLDPRITANLAVARIQRAVEQYQAGRLEPARQTWAALEELRVESPDDLTCSRWALLTRQGVLEQCFGDPAAGTARLGEARASSPSPEAFLFHAHFAQRIYAPKQRGRWLDEFSARSRTDARIGHSSLLVAILQYWKTLLGERVRAEAAQLHQYVRHASRQPFTRDEAAALLFSSPSTPEWNQAMQPIIKRILRQDPKDPLFRFVRQMHELDPEDPAHCRLAVAEFESILKEAIKRDDHRTAKTAQVAINEIGGRLAQFDDFNRDDDIWRPPPIPTAVDSLDSPAPEFAAPTEWEELLQLIADASPRQIKDLKRNPPPGIPRAFLDILISAVRDGDWMPPLPPFPSPSGASRSSPRPKDSSASNTTFDHPELPF